MPAWEQVVVEAADLAARVQSRFGANRHATLATLRRDGSPRISGVETQFGDGQMTMGMMGGSVKALDLRRDPRFALHSATVDPTMAEPDARVAGRAVEVTDQEIIDVWLGGVSEEPPGPFHLFRLDVIELVLVGVERDHLVVEFWHPDKGITRVDRF